MKFESRNIEGIKQYFINGKQVDINTYISMIEDDNEKYIQINNNQNKNSLYHNPNSENNEDGCICDGEGICFVCALKNLIAEIRECDDEEALELLQDFLDGFEEDTYKSGLREGLETGSKQILRHFIEEMSQIVYSPMNIDFGDEMGEGD
ncbi:MAG: hypothetical protein VB084_13540 [Syntrophomonadaceae bacterium]|nr:hypothetical protein [Syntrophomonadaceae bacterium]